MTAVLLACLSAVLFGAASVFIRIGLRRGADAELGALSTVLVALSVCVVAAAVAGESLPVGGVWPFLLAGLLAPDALSLSASLAADLRAWQDLFEDAFHWDSGWRTLEAEARNARAASRSLSFIAMCKARVRPTIDELKVRPCASTARR